MQEQKSKANTFFKQQHGKKAQVVHTPDLNNAPAKLPPSSVELEEAILGALMLEKNALHNVIEFLKTEHFYDPRHAVVYEAIVALFNESNPVDMRTVVNKLRTMGKIEMAGGAFRIAELTAKVSSSANIEYHARVIMELSTKRTLIEISSQVYYSAHEDTTDVFELLDRTEQSIFEIAHDSMKRSVVGMKSLIHNAMEQMRSTTSQQGVYSGFIELDRIIGAFIKTDLIIIAARPSMGKTALITSIMRNVSVDFKVPVALFSLEMASIQLINRLLSAESEIESAKLKTGALTDVEMQSLTHCASSLMNAPIFIDDTPALTILELRSKARRLKAEHNIQIIIVDYLQLMRGDQNGTREQEIASISRALKQIAKELDIPVIALSQLSRGVESRGGDKRPNLSDLRESGSIEQDADLVMFLYRPEYYKIEVDEDNNSTAGVAEVIVAKHRNGPTGTAKLKFISSFAKFQDLV